MRNLFDQYSQNENRLTHALVSTLGTDKRLLRRFVDWVTHDASFLGRGIEIDEQQLPGEESTGDEREAERRGIPDAWIYDDKPNALVIESKINCRLSSDQLAGHVRTARRRDFARVKVLALVLNRRDVRGIHGSVKIVEWSELYSWFSRMDKTTGIQQFVEYMEILEQKLVADESLTNGKLTVFSGVDFDRETPYTYKKARRLMKLLTEELRTRSDLRRKLRMDSGGPGRPAITGREGSGV
jgi:hypothetical protein